MIWASPRSSCAFCDGFRYAVRSLWKIQLELRNVGCQLRGQQRRRNQQSGRGEIGKGLEFSVPAESFLITQYSLKFTSTFTCTATGKPSFVPGANRHFFTASIAFSSSPMPSERATRMLRACP